MTQDSSAQHGHIVEGIRTGLELDGLCHDLRQPLAAIVLLAEAARQEASRTAAEDSAGLVKVLTVISAQAHWLTQVVDDVLDPTGGVGDVRAVDMFELAGACVARVALEPGLLPVRLLGERRVFVLAEPVRLQRALANVLENAARAAGPGGRVDVTVSRVDRTAVVTVADDGPGLGGLPSGTGLGLLLARAFLAQHGGTVELTRSCLGGVLVTLSLPLLHVARG